MNTLEEAKDDNGEESGWVIFEISMPKNKVLKEYNPWILRLIQLFPSLEYLI